MPRVRSSRKSRKTFSLSRETVKYLETLRKQSRRESMSAVLEELIRQQQEMKEMERISASAKRYYDSLSPEEVAEDRDWGDVAAASFPSED
ncbi:MAG TPA: hypothetical protein VIH89_07110 [Candidatus Sulfotelmatobacter sp.]|jgi:hypothetical protein